jgi:MscS family membrane protein
MQSAIPSLEWIWGKSWIIELFVVVILLLSINLFLKRIFLRSKRRGELSESDWRFHLDYAAITPARVLLWILLIAFGIDVFAREFQLAGFSYIAPLRNAAIIFSLAWFLLRWKRVLHRVALARPLHDAKGHPRVDPFTVEMASKIFTIFVIFITLLIVMSIFGLNIAPLIAFGGIGAASLGIAGKDVIANFFSGFMLYLTRPFTIGDQIELQQRKLLGHVEEIGWYFTSIRDSQKKPIYIPNAVFSTEPLMNLSRMTHRRMEEFISVRYEDLEKVPKMLEEIRALIQKHPEVDLQLPICVFLEKFGDSALQIEIKVYFLCTRYEEFMQVKQDLLGDIYRLIQNAGVPVPYPTMQVRLQQ